MVSHVNFKVCDTYHIPTNIFLLYFLIFKTAIAVIDSSIVYAICEIGETPSMLFEIRLKKSEQVVKNEVMKSLKQAMILEEMNLIMSISSNVLEGQKGMLDRIETTVSLTYETVGIFDVLSLNETDNKTNDRRLKQKCDSSKRTYFKSKVLI